MKQYQITKKQYYYLLPAKKMCNLNLYEINSKYYFMGTEEEHKDLMARLRYLD